MTPLTDGSAMGSAVKGNPKIDSASDCGHFSQLTELRQMHRTHL